MCVISCVCVCMSVCYILCVRVLPCSGKKTTPCAGGDRGVPGSDRSRCRPVSEDCLVMIWDTVLVLAWPGGETPRNTGFSWPAASLRRDTHRGEERNYQIDIDRYIYIQKTYTVLYSTQLLSDTYSIILSVNSLCAVHFISPNSSTLFVHSSSSMSRWVHIYKFSRRCILISRVDCTWIHTYCT